MNPFGRALTYKKVQTSVRTTAPVSRVQMDIARNMSIICFVAYFAREVATLEKRADSFVLFIEIHAVTRENSPHQITYSVHIRLIDEKMNMISHERVGY